MHTYVRIFRHQSRLVPVNFTSLVFLDTNTHRLSIALRPFGRGISVLVLFVTSESIFKLHASFYLAASLDTIADLNVVVISPTEITTYAASKP